MGKYYSKRYLKEKWDHLKWDMEEVLFKVEEDKIPEEMVDRVKREMTYFIDAIKKELNKWRIDSGVN